MSPAANAAARYAWITLSGIPGINKEARKHTFLDIGIQPP
jgi:hypothetical protein